MQDYRIRTQAVGGTRTEEHLTFGDDDAAISYALPLARGKLIEIWNEEKLIATVDERPCLTAAA